MTDIQSVVNKEKADLAYTSLQHICQLDVDSTPNIIRKTGIICTIGPSSRSVQVLIEMIKAGMNIARLNFSHGNHDYHAETIKNIREAINTFKPKVPVAIALDIKGPKIRTGILEPNIEEIELKEGKQLRLTVDKTYSKKCNSDLLYIDYPKLITSVYKGNKIFIDDGLISLSVQDIGEDYAQCIVENGGRIGSFKGVNLPGVSVDLPPLSEKDISDIHFGIENDVDMVFASFVRDANGVKEVRKALGDTGKKILVISKVESHQGLKHIDEIIKESDGVMVARGDMGIEIPPEKVFLAQKMIIGRCNLAGKSCICATQMLESMIANPRPTRAEVSDVANAVLDGADCTMLSGETAKGKYPVLSINIMARISLEAEAALFHKQFFQSIVEETKTPVATVEGISIAAVEASFKSNAKCIITLTQTGRTATALSKFRPKCVIYAVTRSWKVCVQLHLYRGIIPIFCQDPPLKDWCSDVDHRVKLAVNHCKDSKVLKTGDTMILVTGWKEGSGFTNTMRIVPVD
ncbi:unnamed protein product [Gordionus sp. m RMFG-2023]|uniref:pyruvate kinase PKM-like n=1 Tax=Gordionus sp. m RMFG-2023 TaxID=3053472 RepID=UPI0030E33821